MRRSCALGLLLAALASISTACHPSRATPGATESGAVDMPLYIGRPVGELREALVKQLGLPAGSDVKSHGVEIEVRDGLVDTVFIHLVPENGKGPTYDGPLFRGLARTMHRAEVEQLLGPPDSKADPQVTQLPPYTSMNWIKYNRAEAQLHFQFAVGDGPLEMITLMRPHWKPGDR